MSEQKVHPLIAQCIVIIFLAREGVTTGEICQRLNAQFSDKTLSRTHVFAWHKKFKEGERVENQQHDCRPWTRITNKNICVVKDIIDDDRRARVSEIAQKVGISYESCQAIITNYLQFHFLRNI
ncbi:protein GVQW3-like [Schistocerca serialis cubense]|uniref:protein GVQW3-like n=1 Tax=Schistocerca serialis cubense TaxID=2023355 RepID=UPI00214F4C74|nr:protein GVQW3-like [Schistocerca serialis cubense]